jgi:RNA polymerase sigma-70 factor (ECF subfamily)
VPRPDAPGPRLLSDEREASLAAGLIARDERALAQLVGVATPWLLAVAQAMLADRDEAEEVVQETFTIAWRRVDLFDRSSGRLMPWLLRITRNRAIDRLRGRRRRVDKARRLLSFGGLGESRAAPVEPDEAGTPGWQVHRAVHAALATLPPEQREVVQLAYFEGLTHSEIAGRLSIPLGTVKTRLRLAFDKLRGGLSSLKDWVV